jgi:group I intron endonuclease
MYIIPINNLNNVKEINMFLYHAIFPNGKRYIGITRNINRRKIEHKKNINVTRYRHIKLYRAINKYGFDNLIWLVADGYTDWIKLQQTERNEIAIYQTTENKFGYNTNKGGEGNLGFHHSEETKQLLSKIVKEQQAPKISKMMTGKGNPMFGKCGELSPSFGKPSKLRGTHLPQKQKEHLSEIRKGKNNPMFGKTTSAKQKIAVSLACSGENNCNAKLTFEQAKIIRIMWASNNWMIKDLAKLFNININAISRIVHNKSYIDKSYIP